jgi:glycosyltransferase involved in cell wall biosynthesis
MQISIVIPLKDEAESLPELHDWIVKVMTANNFSYEILFIDDGSKDNSWSIIEELRQKNNHVKAIKFRRNYGKSPALFEGFEAAEGDIVITMDADLQDSPDEIPELYKMVKEGGYDLVSGWKQKRYDNAVTKNIPSKLYNWTNRKISGIKLHDMNCGLKAYRKEVIKSIEVYGEMHRFIPVLAKNAGFNKIGEKVVQHQARKYGVSKFGWDRFINGFLDLMTITFLSKFGKRPMHFFGLLGTIMFFIGFSIVVYIGADKLYHVFKHIPARKVADLPVFYIALTTMVLGTMLFLAGFLGELILRNSPVRNNYLIEKELK